MDDTADDDASLARRLASGDPGALATAFDRFAPALTRYAWAIAGSRQDVEELVQDTFLTLWQKADGVQLATGGLLPWLLVVCRNHARNLGRRNAQHDADDLPAELAAPAADTDAADQLRWVRDEIAALPETDRLICELCLVQGYSYAEAAQLLGLTVGTVTQRVSRSRRRLRKAVANDGR
ncbi:RNA polymerase sigma factor [Curtobacterium sp. 22159]|uniref:RNA polymerase sigma factor n=1 Tax=Curtobacterium sp. 22159 TaxID=3453882 RepID=UPI003F853831